MSQRQTAVRPLSWTALTPTPPRRWDEIAAIVLRNVIPLIGMIAFGWSVVQFLLLSVFNSALTIVNIGVAGVSASMLREAASTPAKPGLAQWPSLIAVGVFLSLLLTTLGGWPIFVMTDQGPGVLRQAGLWWSALAMVIASVPALRAEIRDKVQSPLDLEQLKRRDQPRVGAAFLGIGASLVLSGWAAGFGSAGLALLVAAFTAFALVRELRPDWIHEGLRPKNEPP